MFIQLAAFLLVQQPAPGPGMSEAQFCAGMTQLTAQMNADTPQMLSPSGRLDHVDLSCTARRLVFNKSLLLPETDFPAGWRDEFQADLNRIACREGIMRRMAQRGWRFEQIFTFPDGSRVGQVARCE